MLDLAGPAEDQAAGQLPDLPPLPQPPHLDQPLPHLGHQMEGWVMVQELAPQQRPLLPHLQPPAAAMHQCLLLAHYHPKASSSPFQR